MRKSRLTREEKIYIALGKAFLMILFSIPFGLIFAYGLMHATTLN